MLILNRFLFYIVFILSFVANGQQDEMVKKWESERKAYEYKKSHSYKGPTNWDSGSPRRISSKSNYGKGRGGYSTRKSSSGGGGLKKNRTISKPRATKQRETPKINPPKINVNSSIWNVLLIIIIALIVVVVIYLLIKNRSPKEQKVVANIEDDWNPEIISKSELELRLEAAIAKENYRECIRIYFTFILKELIKKSWIFWRKEKTNLDYIFEMRARPESFEFEECVRLFDVVWYGEYHIDKKSYSSIAPVFEKYYKQLSTSR